MSRIGKKQINIPQGVTAAMQGTTFTVTGALGTLTRVIVPEVAVQIEGNIITLAPTKEGAIALWGTYASLISGMIVGVTKGFSKKLILEGIGYKSEVKGSNIVLALGFSHLVTVAIPAGLKVTAEKNNITVSGIDKQVVGEFAAKLRSLKKPEPYKGKGMRYDNEVVKRKQGKKTA